VSPDNELVTAFVNERPVRVPRGSAVLAAVRAHDPALAARVAAGEGYLTDGRGIRVTPDQPLPAGAIIRVVVPARRSREPDAQP